MFATAQPDFVPITTEYVSDAPAHDTDLHGILAAATTRAARENLPYAGTVPPHEAWALAEAGVAVLIDVRTTEEYKYVGHVPGTQLVQWQSGRALTKNPRFARELAGKAGKNDVILLICRSGKRSAAAAEAATRAGFLRVFNVLEGFEGEITADGQRGATGGWRYHGLPWVQD